MHTRACTREHTHMHTHYTIISGTLQVTYCLQHVFLSCASTEEIMAVSSLPLSQIPREEFTR